MAIRSYLWRNAQAAIAGRSLIVCSLLAGVTFVGAGVMAVSSNDSLFGSRAEAATTSPYAPDLDNVLDGRSPGQRRYGWLLNNKPDRLTFSAGDPPSERVLTATRRRPASGPDIPVSLDTPLTLLGIVPDTTGVSPDLGDSIVPASFGGGVGGAPIIGGIAGPGGGGGGGTPTEPVIPTPETSVPAVPEPSSWAMLVMGFATLGTFMRRRRSVSIAVTVR